MRRCSPMLLPLIAAGSLGAQTSKPPGSPAPRLPAAISTIREADLERDLYALAGDDMRGREAGTLDEMRASMWLADEMRKIGVAPRGEGGSWFQWWSMRRTRISNTTSSVQIGGRQLALWSDVTPAANTAADIVGTTRFAGDGSDSTVDVRGRVVVVTLTAPPAASIRSTTNTYAVNYTRAAIAQTVPRLTRRGAAAVIVVADSIAELAFEGIARTQMRGTYDVVGGVPRFVRSPAVAAATGAPTVTPVPVLLAHRSALADLRTDGRSHRIATRASLFRWPSKPTASRGSS